MRSLLLILIAVLCLTLGACNKTNAPTESAATPAQNSTNTFTITGQFVNAATLNEPVSLAIETTHERVQTSTQPDNSFSINLSAHPGKWIIFKPRIRGWHLSQIQEQGALMQGQTESLMWQLPTEISFPLNIQLSLEQVPTLSGQVRLRGGVLAKNAKVMLIWRNSANAATCEWDSTATDGDGRFFQNLTGMSGAELCVIVRDEMRKHSVQKHLSFDKANANYFSANETLTLTLEPEISLDGVLRSPTGEALANARLQPYYRTDFCGMGTDSTEVLTDENGRFTVSALHDTQLGLRLRTADGQTISAWVAADEWARREATLVFDRIHQELYFTFDSPKQPRLKEHE